MTHGAPEDPSSAEASQTLPSDARQLRALSKTLIARKKFAEAFAVTRQLLAIDPNDLDARATLAFLDASSGHLDEGLARLREIEKLAPLLVTPTIVSLMLYSAMTTPEEILEVHLRRGAQIEAEATGEVQPSRSERPARLKVGYVSADFRQHSVASFIEPILRCHDRARFEVHAYHTRSGADEVTRAIAALGIDFHDVSALDDAELAERIREDEIDLLVDLGGHTEHSRIGVFARRPAPVMVSYLGYAATTGLRAIDARITDEIADPPGVADDLHTERLQRLASPAWCFSPPLHGPPTDRNDASPFTFGSFNALAKVGPDVVRTWAAILNRVPDSRLYLKARALSSSVVGARITELFAESGIGPERLVMKGWELDTTAHLAEYANVDVALDPFPYNGTTTTCEALWMGVPVVTLSGDRHSSRVGASLLTAMGFQDFVAKTTDDYVAIAVGLATDRGRHIASRSELRERMANSQLCNPESFVKKLEAAYDQIFALHTNPGKPVLSTEDATRLTHEARIASDAGKLPLAAHYARRVLAVFPGQVDLAMIAARASEALGDSLGAERVLNKAAESNPATHRDPNVSSELHESESAGSPPSSILDLRSLLTELGRLRGLRGNSIGEEDALRRSVALYPDSPDARVALAIHLRSNGRTDEAAVELHEALRLAPKHPRAIMLLGILEMSWGAAEKGIALLGEAVTLDPSDAVAFSNWLYAHQAVSTSREEGFRRHLRFGARFGRSATRSACVTKRGPSELDSKRLRIGYLSADFREHSIARFMEAILSNHDRERFDVTLYASVKKADHITERLASLADRMIVVTGLDDDDLAERIASDRIDILIELGGHTAKSRILVMRHQPAPIQVSYLGYPDTTGVPAIDYRLTDSIADPDGDADPFHVETLIRLPDAAWCFQARPESPPVRERPLGAPVVFGSFNDTSKIGDAVLDTWAEILAALPNSRLLLKAKFAADEAVRTRVLNAFARRKIDAKRLELRYGSADVSVHLEAYGDMDIALDPFPYCGTTTTCEALDMGVPVVSLAGDRHVARVGASLLARVGLSDLVATSRERYVDIALKLGRDAERRKELRHTLRDTLRASVICDGPRFTRGLESCFESMWRAHRANQRLHGPPADGVRRMRATELVAEAMAALAQGRVEDAEVVARQAIATDPGSPEAHNVLGNVLMGRGNSEAAELAYRSALEVDPTLHKPYHNLGNILRARGDLKEASRWYSLATEKNKAAHRSFAALAGVLVRLGNKDEAEAAFRSALQGPQTKESWEGLGTLLSESKRFAESIDAFNRAVALGASGFPIHMSLAEAAIEIGNLALAKEAVEAARRGLQLTATGASRIAATRLASAYLALGRANDAVELIETAVLPSARPESPLLCAALDVLWRSKLGANDFEGAWSAFERALREGDAVLAYSRSALLQKGAPPTSGGTDNRLIETLRRVMVDRPNNADLPVMVGSQLLHRGFSREAWKVLSVARERHPTSQRIVSAMGEVKLQEGEQREAVLLHREAIALAPNDIDVQRALLSPLHYAEGVSREEVFLAHIAWGKNFSTGEPPKAGPRPAKLRVGYLSSDFFRHSVCRFILPLLIGRDRSRFDVYAYMTGPEHDDFTDLVIANVDRFHRAMDDSDAALAARIRADQIDVLIDLSGHTGRTRITAMAERPARVQITYLGYPDTTGLDAMDYRIADAITDPPGGETFTVEEIIRLPRPAWCFAPGGVPVTRPRPRRGPVVFGSFNNVTKITPRVVDTWARILRSVDESRLVLKWTSFKEPETRSLWQGRFERAGVNPERLSLRGFVEQDAGHMEMYGDIDIALDTFPYNGTTTTCEAIVMGIPVITLIGDRHVSRVGFSLLSSVGLSELCAPSIDDYEKLAVDLSRDHTRRAELRGSIQGRYEQSLLANADDFTCVFESTIEEMYERGPRVRR